MKQYDLSTNSDKLWRDTRGLQFSDVAEAIQEEVVILRDYERRMEELKQSMELGNSNDSAAFGILSDNTSKLTNAIR
ncbi:unnamed protein product [Protopolystoma xenopodis]|uniref:Uncharacterized protein n=1 Tax=Protopolystoma xenopodis TaxID=117903 RepID=A0A448XQE7_9PLAT|nr:unnamed protein product [Protopolystoma xenopodis]